MTDKDDLSRLESGGGMLTRKRFTSLKMEATVYQEATNLQPPLDPPQPTEPKLPQIDGRSGWGLRTSDSPEREPTPNPVVPKSSSTRHRRRKASKKKAYH